MSIAAENPASALSDNKVLGRPLPVRDPVLASLRLFKKPWSMSCVHNDETDAALNPVESDSWDGVESPDTRRWLSKRRRFSIRKSSLLIIVEFSIFLTTGKFSLQKLSGHVPIDYALFI